MSTTTTSSSPLFRLPQRDSPLALRIAIVSVIMGMFMQMLDATIANVTLPYMQGSLGASRDEITWVLTSYVIAAAIMTGPVGWLATRFGRREILLISLIGFTTTSALCGLAQSLDQIVLFRVLQGAFGAALSPLSQAIILDRYSLQERGKIMAVWSVITMLGPILGPTLGGFLTDNYSWRWVFYVNVPIGIVCIAGIYFFMFEDRVKRPPGFDWHGFIFLSLALGALQLLFDRGTDKDWFSSTEIIAEAVIAGLAFYLFLVSQFTTKHPFIDFGLFKDRNFLLGTILTFLVAMLLLATSALLPPYLQNLGGYSVLDTGLMLAPRGFGTMISMMLMGRLMMKIDTRYCMVAGGLALLWSMWTMSGWTPDVSSTTLSLTTFVQGFGMGLVFVPMNMFTYATLPAAHRVSASSFLSIIRNLGAAIGISFTATLLTRSSQINYNQLAEHATPFNRALGQNAASMMLNPQIPFGVATLHGLIVQQSTIIAYANVFLFLFFASMPVLGVIFLFRKDVLLTATDAPPIEAE